ncbi:MAG TPA: CDP-alcohol phosphatidyltransferase family protein [Arenicellales bacterium]|nr:CDP-alcohol phosphatidyltransferase family protein [Arenicellales bacterium]
MSIEQIRAALHRQANALIDPLILRFARSGFTPDAITVSGLVFSAVAAGFLAAGMPRSAGVIWLLASSLDMLDGALARRTGATNRSGAFLDSSLDRVSEGVLLTAAVYYFAVLGAPVVAAVAAWAMLASLMVSYTRARGEGLGTECRGGLATRVERVILLGLGLVFGVLPIAIGVLAVLATVTTVQRIVLVRAALSRDEGADAEPRSG